MIADVTARSAGWVPLASLLGTAGVVHLVRPALFDPVVPRALPGPARAWTLASGVAEVALAAGLAVPATRSVSGRAAAGFLLAVWPGNVQMTLDAARRRHRSRAAAVRYGVSLVRLPLQVPLVRAAWRAGTRA